MNMQYLNGRLLRHVPDDRLKVAHLEIEFQVNEKRENGEEFPKFVVDVGPGVLMGRLDKQYGLIWD